jgi:hypothetical protein
MGYTSFFYDDGDDDDQKSLRDLYIAKQTERSASLARDGTIVRSQTYHPHHYRGNNCDGHRSTERIVIAQSKQQIPIPSSKRHYSSTRGAIVGMDGAVHNVSTGSRTSSSSGSSNSKPSAPHSVYMPPGGFCEEKDAFEVSVRGSVGKRRGRGCFHKCMVLTAAIVLIGVMCGTIGYYVVKRTQENKSAAPAGHSTANLIAVDLADGECRDGFIEERHFPHLSLYLRGLNDLVDESGRRDLEEAVWLGYNNVTEGCGDTYHRWMYNVKMINQTLVQNVVLEDGTTPLETLFDGSPSVLAHFELKISCKGCERLTAFASIYPKEFGSNATVVLPTEKPSNTGEEGGHRKKKRKRARKLQVWSYDSSDLGPHTLDAGKILLSIETFARKTFSDLKDFPEAKIKAIEADGSMETMSIQKAREGNSEYVTPTFFRNKVVAETKHKRGCRKKTNKTKNAKGPSTVKMNTRGGGRGGDDDDDDDDGHRGDDDDNGHRGDDDDGHRGDDDGDDDDDDDDNCDDDDDDDDDDDSSGKKGRGKKAGGDDDDDSSSGKKGGGKKGHGDDDDDNDDGHYGDDDDDGHNGDDDDDDGHYGDDDDDDGNDDDGRHCCVEICSDYDCETMCGGCEEHGDDDAGDDDDDDSDDDGRDRGGDRL